MMNLCDNTKGGSIYVFDLDGTIADTKPGIIEALNYVLKSKNYKTIDKNEEDKYIGPPIKDSFKKYLNLSEFDASICTELYRRSYVEKFIQNSRLYNGIRYVLKTLRSNGHNLGIATMKTKSQTEAFLKIFKMDTEFDIVKTASDLGNISKVDMLMEIREQYKKECDSFFMIGDTIGDYNAAIDAGFNFIAADYGYWDIKNIECRHISNLYELVS